MIGRKRERRRYNNNYYRYESLAEIKRKLTEGEVISAFTLEDHEDAIFVAFGDGGETCNVVQMRMKGDRVQRECGMRYMQYELEDLEDYVVDKLKVVALEDDMRRYCLLLPFVYKGDENFEQDFAVVYDNWEVGNERGESEIPSICTTLFAIDVLAAE